MFHTQLLPASAALAQAADLLRQGELVAFPTETVYGLGADARNPDAVEKIYLAKGRPSTNPLIVHVADTAAARRYVTAFSPQAEKLAAHFWPGPLTLVLPRSPDLTPRVSAGLATVAIRCPNHPLALDLLRAFDGPVAAPSANRSGFISPTTAQHVLAELNGRIPLILDGGPSHVGVESTVLDLSSPAGPTILRPGAVTREMIQTLIGPVHAFVGHSAPDMATPSPGMLERHYSPHTPAYRFSLHQWSQVQTWAEQQKKVVLITHNPTLTLPPPHEVELLPNDSLAYARVLYASLRQADSKAASSLVVLLPDTEEGLWTAVHDRLRRATQTFEV